MRARSSLRLAFGISAALTLAGGCNAILGIHEATEIFEGGEGGSATSSSSSGTGGASSSSSSSSSGMTSSSSSSSGMTSSSSSSGGMLDGGLVDSGQPCTDAKDCATITPDCQVPTCEGGFCWLGANASQGTPANDQIPGDCTRLDCNGAGNTTPAVDTSDVPLTSDCAMGQCSPGGTPVTTNLKYGQACSGGICDGLGNCGGACADSTHNNMETDVDCGGPTCLGCGFKKGCVDNSDCTSSCCVQGAATTIVAPHNSTGTPPTGACYGGTCCDGVQNGTETDVDCGGPACPGCKLSQLCAGNADCASGNCTGGKCGL